MLFQLEWISKSLVLSCRSVSVTGTISSAEQVLLLYVYCAVCWPLLAKLLHRLNLVADIQNDCGWNWSRWLRHNRELVIVVCLSSEVSLRLLAVGQWPSGSDTGLDTGVEEGRRRVGHVALEERRPARQCWWDLIDHCDLCQEYLYFNLLSAANSIVN